ncbi:hypothetical protein [Novosphingobium sp. ST904]|uniref:hypothetical protein n=1 Tax=Novosphingobium sp. ST904 TaxID=1684385 RepID=UPI001050A91F|nr:hypothetical protein [Novosphingobium sp. ST904]TCM32384.1 hypothetical protein EDF59_12479 [Novosphingobium sp. ST904]
MTAIITSLRSDLEAIADSINVGGADYEIWACRFSEACGGYFSTLDPDQRRAAIGIASDLGYRTPEEEPEYNPGVCWRSGINSAYCHCGHHE